MPNLFTHATFSNSSLVHVFWSLLLLLLVCLCSLLFLCYLLLLLFIWLQAQFCEHFCSHYYSHFLHMVNNRFHSLPVLLSVVACCRIWALRVVVLEGNHLGTLLVPMVVTLRIIVFCLIVWFLVVSLVPCFSTNVDYFILLIIAAVAFLYILCVFWSIRWILTFK